MTTSRVFHLLIALCLVLTGCNKDDPKPLGSEVNGVLLAGEKGKSKSWRIKDGTSQVGTDAAQPFAVDPCLMDNIYTFTHDDAQSYQATEGAIKCDPADPDVIESGTWAFT